MSEFTHSIVLFSGDDGLPLEFNVRNTNDKSRLKAIIEHGGGLCTQSDNAVRLISPGTKVLNADLGKKLVSSRYVYDCVKQNYLLEVNDYVFTITEAQTSDISDEDSGKEKISPDILKEKQTIMNSDVNVDISTTVERLNRNESSLTTPSKLGSQQKSGVSSNQSESFIEGSQDVTGNPRITAGLETCEYIPLTSTAKEPDSMDPDYYEDIEKDLSPIQPSASLMSPQKRTNIASQYGEKNSPIKVGFTNKEILSPNRAPLQQKRTPFLKNSPKKVGFTNKEILSPNRVSIQQAGTLFQKNSPKNVAFTNKEILSPNRASLVAQQKETLFQCENRHSSKEIFSREDAHSKDPIQNEGSIEIDPVQYDSSIEMDPVQNDSSMEMDPIRNEGLTYSVSPRKRIHTFPRYEQQIEEDEDSDDESLIPDVLAPPVLGPSVLASPAHAAVSSSQPTMGDLDQFDNLLLSKAQQKVPSDDEDRLSQSYTVSSSADAQKPSSSEVNSAEMFNAGPSSQLPDSPTHIEGQGNERSLYIQRLEAEVENILQKPSPKSIQDKILLVKYICCVKKLAPAAVLQSLQQL